MKVLVSGSLRGIPDDLRPKLVDAAKELGKCLAQSGHTLLVGSDDPEDTDPHVVEGFQSVDKAPAVEVHLPRGARTCYSGKDKKTIKNIAHRYDDWDVTVLQVMRENADAVVVIAGLKGVIQAGIAGWMLGRPTIPFAGFGGGAVKVWDYGSSDRRRFYFNALSDAEIDQLNSAWAPDTAAMIVDQLGRCADAARRAGVSPTLRNWVTVGILITLIAWVLLLTLPLLGWPAVTIVPPGTTPAFDTAAGKRLLILFGAVCSAGAFGALVQSMRGVRNGEAVTPAKAWMDAVLGIAAGFLTAALYMLAQIALGGELKPLITNADYSRVSLVVSMAAVFASLYLDSAFSRFDGFKESVLSGKYGSKDDTKSTSEAGDAAQAKGKGASG